MDFSVQLVCHLGYIFHCFVPLHIGGFNLYLLPGSAISVLEYALECRSRLFTTRGLSNGYPGLSLGGVSRFEPDMDKDHQGPLPSKGRSGILLCATEPIYHLTNGH